MLSRLIQGSIRIKLGILFLAAALPAIVIILVNGLETRNKAISKSEAELLQFTAQVAATQENTTLKVHLLLEQLARMPEVRKADADACRKIFTETIKNYPLLAGIHLVNSKGDLVASTTKTVAANLAHTKHFINAVATKNFSTGEYITGVLRPISLFPFAHPIMDEAENVQSVLLTSIQLESYSDQFLQMPFPNDSFVGICDHKGTRIFRYPETSAGPAGGSIRLPMFEAAKAGALQGLKTEICSDGIERVIAYRTVRLKPDSSPYLYVFVGSPKAVIHTEARQGVLRNLFLFIVVIALTMVMGWFLGGKSLGIKIEELAMAAAQIGQGNLNVRISENSDVSEIATVSKEFNRMADSLAQDLAMRKQTELALLQARNYVSNIIDSMPSVLASVDTNGNITQWNIEAEKDTGLKKDAVMGQPLEKALPRLAGEMELVHKAMNQRRTIRDSNRPHNVDGMMCYEDVTIFPLITNGVEGAVIRVDNVTERVRLEQMMVQSEKMMTVGGLAAGMAHEINNPLAAILGGAQNIKRRMFEALPRNTAVAKELGVDLVNLQNYMNKRGIPKLIDGIDEAGNRAAKIVRNMLNFSRKSCSTFAYCDLPTLLDQTLDLIASDYDMKKPYDFKNIKIIKNYAPDMPPVRCESNQIQQVFLNLLKNAAEAMADKDYGGNAPCFVLRATAKEDMAEIEIEDNGPGLATGNHMKVFEPFFTTKPPGKGTGLGLSVSYFIIVDQHGGKIEVTSSPGQWTRFTIKLPLENTEIIQPSSALE